MQDVPLEQHDRWGVIVPLHVIVREAQTGKVVLDSKYDTRCTTSHGYSEDGRREYDRAIPVPGRLQRGTYRLEVFNVARRHEFNRFDVTLSLTPAHGK